MLVSPSKSGGADLPLGHVSSSTWRDTEFNLRLKLKLSPYFAAPSDIVLSKLSRPSELSINRSASSGRKAERRAATPLKSSLPEKSWKDGLEND